MGRSGERGSDISVLVAWHDDDYDDDIYICVCVCVCLPTPQHGPDGIRGQFLNKL